jgi:hypothetical protein
MLGSDCSCVCDIVLQLPTYLGLGAANAFSVLLLSMQEVQSSQIHADNCRHSEKILLNIV